MTELHTIANKRMSRKKFLIYIGMFLLTILGIYKLLNLVGIKFGDSIPVQTQGYGSTPYGN